MFLKSKLKNNTKKLKSELFIVERKKPFWISFLLILPALIILLTFTIIPFIYALNDALTVDDAKPLDILSPNLDNFKFVAKDALFIESIENSLIYAFFIVPVSIFVAILISFSISTFVRKKARGFFQTLFFLPYVTSVISISLAFAFIFDFDAGLINKIIALSGGKKFTFLNDTEGKKHALIVMWTLGIWRSIAFNVLILTTAMLSVDKNKYKAASIDGATKFKQLFKITLPLISRTLNFLIIMGIINSIKVFPLALFDNNSGDAKINGGSTLMLYIYSQINDTANYGKAGAASFYLLLISIAFSVVLKGGFNYTLKFIKYLGEKNV